MQLFFLRFHNILCVISSCAKSHYYFLKKSFGLYQRNNRRRAFVILEPHFFCLLPRTNRRKIGPFLSYSIFLLSLRFRLKEAKTFSCICVKRSRLYFWTPMGQHINGYVAKYVKCCKLSWKNVCRGNSSTYTFCSICGGEIS